MSRLDSYKDLFCSLFLNIEHILSEKSLQGYVASSTMQCNWILYDSRCFSGLILLHLFMYVSHLHCPFVFFFYTFITGFLFNIQFLVFGSFFYGLGFVFLDHFLKISINHILKWNFPFD